MENKTRPSPTLSALDTELLFLITKYLEAGPCNLSARVLKQELEKNKVLPTRLDWEGNEHEQSFRELEKKYTHIRPSHLLEICSRIAPILDREVKPNVSGLTSLLGAGRQSLLRTAKDVDKLWLHIVEYSARLNQRALYPPISCANHNIVKVLNGRENAGPIPRDFTVSNQIYSKTQLLCCTLGHLSAVYCLLFDHTGKYVITGADDLLVKVWSAVDGRLLASLRGASAEISDIAINVENTLLAAGSIDRIIRVWCLQTAAPVAILTAHSGMITGVNFCPGIVDNKHYLASTSSDGSVAIWCYSGKNPVIFNSKPIQFIERTRPGNAQMISAAFSSGGMFLAAGSADHYVRVYQLSGIMGPQRVLEAEAHTDRVDSIQWANLSLRFVSGSKDGTALIWQYLRQQWTSTKLLMTTKLPKKTGVSEELTEEEAKQKLKVTMVSWDCRDRWVVTACSDHTLKVWESVSGTLLQLLTGHKDEVFVLEGHPLDSQIFMSAGHDGLILLWNVVSGKMIASFQNNIENQGHGAVFDAKWSPDGTMLAATDSHGQILMFGLGSKPAKMLQLPKELFFHTDYRPLVRDLSHAVLDEQTQMAPHLMPPPFLVDVDGNPYPPNLQRLVPGRENCTTEQLVPNIILNQEGQQEVIQGVQEARSNIDLMIRALVHVVDGEQQPTYRHNLTSPRARTGARREGDVEGVRQSRGNWQRDEINWTQRQMVQPLDKASLHRLRARIQYLGELELQDYERESLKPKEEIPAPIVKPTEKKQQKKRTHGYRTRAVREQQLQDQFEDPSQLEISGSEERENSSQDSTACSENLDSGSTSSSESASSEYSDWIRDEGEAMEPPKRRSKRIQKSPVKPMTKTEVLQEVPEGYRPSEWLSAVIPKKFPYYPQMGDEVVFFKEGYQLYLDAVLTRKIYKLAPAQLNPWGKMNLKEPELVKVVGIRYEIRPPRLCCLRLAVLKRNGHITNDYFTIKYHDLPDVIDFFVLRQTYDVALDRNWDIGDRFKSMIDDHWWWGRIVERRSNSSSEFLKYRIVWDNGESELMSPWDMEPIEPSAEPVEVGGSIPVSAEEIAAVLYRPRPDEWPLGDRDAACERILMGLEQVMELSVAEPFIAPVDLNRYPSYATIVEYPIDLSTIKARFDNRFYRRITTAQFDIRYLATNTEKFNEAHSYIVKQARIVTDLCLKIVKETCTVDVSTLYRLLLESYRSSDSEDTSQQPSTSRHRAKAAAARTMRATRREASRQTGPFDWKRECRELLEMLWACRDSEPFREPLDRLEHEEYYRMVDAPMDLGTMREELRGDNYETPVDFCEDLRRIFTNSKNYSTDKRSRMYTMAVRLSALAEQHMSRILKTWNKLNKRAGVRRRPRRGKRPLLDDGNASVSEYEPPCFKKAGRGKRQLSDGDSGPFIAKSKSMRGKKRYRKRLSDADDGTSLDSIANPSTSSARGSKRFVKVRRHCDNQDSENSNSDGEYVPSASVARTVMRSQMNSDVENTMNSDSDRDYCPTGLPSSSAVNGFIRKRKKTPRPTKGNKRNNEQDSNNEALIGKLNLKHLKSARVRVEVNKRLDEPSTSKSVEVNNPIRRAKMIHVEEKEDSSDPEQDEIKVSALKKPNSSVNGFRRLKSESEESLNPSESEEKEAAGYKRADEVENENEEGSDIEDEEEEDGEEVSDEASDSDPSSETTNNTEKKSPQKTVKCLYPKRKAKETKSSKLSYLNNKQSGELKEDAGRMSRSARVVKINSRKGKYPLRKTVQKNLAEVSSENSEEENEKKGLSDEEVRDFVNHYQTRRSQPKAFNGASVYVEESDGDHYSENEDVEEVDSVEDDSDSYAPPVKRNSRGRKRNRSSDSTADWSGGRSVKQQIRRKTRTSKRSASASDQNRRGRGLRTRKLTNNSESELSQVSNDSDSDRKPAELSVSSRGRVRKLTARARAALHQE